MREKPNPSPVGWVSKLLIVRFSIVFLILAGFFFYQWYARAHTGGTASGTSGAAAGQNASSAIDPLGQDGDDIPAPPESSAAEDGQGISGSLDGQDEAREPLVKAWPIRLRIPALSADAAIEDTGYDDTETMEIVPSTSIISWLREGPIPGNEGNAILGGHNKWAGAEGQLLYLDTLEIGDEMEIFYADESSLTFRLESVFVYPLATADADAIMDLEGEARVTVITCKDPFNPVTGTSDYRIIAVFKEAGVFVVPAPPIEPIPLIEPEEH